jgi:carbon starvation protein
MPGWAMGYQILYDFWPNRNWLLLAFGSAILCLQIWMMIEAVLLWPRVKGVLEEALPPLDQQEPGLAGGRSC